MKNRILVIGSINQDLVVQMERIPKPGETLFGENLKYFPGGKGANQAIAAKLLDSDVIFLGKVGNDIFGENLLEYLSSLNLGAFVQTVVSSATGTAIITVDKSGENAISVISGANVTFQLADLEILNKFDEKDILLVQNEINIPMLYEAIRKAKKHGLKVFYNPAPANKIVDEIVFLCDYIIVNEHELEVCFGINSIDFNNDDKLNEILLDLSEKYKMTLILTLGSRGCKAIQDGEIFDVSGVKVEVVDTTGAGDCFCGALVSHISKANSLNDSLIFANKAASLSVTKLGASISFPKLIDMKNLDA